MSLQLPARRMRDGRPVLAIPVGQGRSQIVLARLRGLRTSPGFRVGADGVAERYLEGFYQEEGRLYLYGPWEPGVTLEEVLEQGKALPCLRGLAQALVALGDRRPEELDRRVAWIGEAARRRRFSDRAGGGSKRSGLRG